MNYRGLLVLSSLVVLGACANDALFGAPGGGGGSATVASSSATDVSSSAVVGGAGPGPASSSSSAGGGVGEGGMGVGPGGRGPGGMGPGGMGEGGGSTTCSHDFCDTGPALASACHPCVTQICQQDPYCCNQQWDGICVGHVDTICMIDCFPSGMGPCGMQYPNHPVCSDDGGQCALAYDATQQSCGALCASGGGECLAAFNDEQNQTCQIDQNQQVLCSSQQLQSAVCICSQGCGSGPACPQGQLCLNGMCF